MESEWTNSTPIDFLFITETWIGKLKELENWIKYNESNIIQEQYTIITDSTEDITNPEGQGTAIILKKTWKKYIRNIHTVKGRATIIKLETKNNNYIIGSIYMPAGKSKDEKTEAKIIKNLINHVTENEPEDTQIPVATQNDHNKPQHR